MIPVLLGSEALRANNIKITRKLKDIDILSDLSTGLTFAKQLFGDTFNQRNNKNHYHFDNRIFHLEVETIDNQLSNNFYQLILNDKNTFKVNRHDFEFLIPSTEILLGLKLTHRYKRNSQHFIKTMRDIQYLRNLGIKVPESKEWKDWFKAREKETYAYDHPSLNMTKKDFFKTPNVKYKYDHDSIHLAVAIGEQPAYMYFKPENSDVLCSKEMFFACDFSVQLNAVIEETMVLALERSLIPTEFKARPIFAYETALKNICTGTTSGWFREFAWENYDLALNAFNLDFVEKYHRAFKDGNILPFKE
jgi:hypothetical protein